MSGLFAPKIAAPKVLPPTPMPDEALMDAARRRRIATESPKSGYTSTVLSAGGRETLGG